MAQARLLYSSENGDRWYLVRGSEPHMVFVRHEPNAASGGQVADLEIGEFLIRGVYGPEHVALLRLIGTLTEGAEQTS
jgi:hypothetical protein